MNHRLLLVLGVLAILLALALLWLGMRIRRRWKQGRQDFEDLRAKARAMELEQQGMSPTTGATTNRPKSKG